MYDTGAPVESTKRSQLAHTPLLAGAVCASAPICQPSNTRPDVMVPIATRKGVPAPPAVMPMPLRM